MNSSAKEPCIQTTISPKKSPIFLRKTPIYPQKSSVYHILRLDRLGSSCCEIKSFAKEPHISANEPHISAKEPHISATEFYDISVKYSTS